MAADRLVHIIDDDAAVRRALVRLLRSMGFTAMTYETAQAVLDDAATLSSGCILLDLQMPGMDGIELLGRLGELGVDLPVIVVTGHGDVPTAVRAMKAGAVDFIEKPIDEDLLLGTINAALAENKPAARDHEAARAVEQMGRLSPRERQVLDAIAVGRPRSISNPVTVLSPCFPAKSRCCVACLRACHERAEFRARFPPAHLIISRALSCRPTRQLPRRSSF